MKQGPRRPVKAYSNRSFLKSKDARALRILAEYLEPLSRFEHHRVDDTIVFMGSARLKPRAEAEEALRRAEGGDGDLDAEASAFPEPCRDLHRAPGVRARDDRRAGRDDRLGLLAPQRA